MMRKKAIKDMEKSPVKNIKIAGGFAIENKEFVFDHIRRDKRVTLVREPDNEYDENAIMVINSEGSKLGYIPKSENVPLAKKMDSGEMGYIGQVTDCNDPINGIYIGIFERPILPIDDMTSFEYELIGLLESSLERYSLNVKRRKLIFEYHECFSIGKIQVVEFVFNKNTWEKAWSSLKKCNFRAWKDDYIDNSIFDGDQWNLRIRFGRGKQLKSSGSNAYPPEWFYFQDLLAEWINLELPLKGNGKFYIIDSQKEASYI